jgi:hypothetical protein
VLCPAWLFAWADLQQSWSCNLVVNLKKFTLANSQFFPDILVGDTPVGEPLSSPVYVGMARNDI